MISDITSPGWVWEHCWWVADATDPAVLPDAGSRGVDAILTGGPGASFVELSGVQTVTMESQQLVARYNVNGTATIEGPTTIVGIGKSSKDTGWLFGGGLDPTHAYMRHEPAGQNEQISAGAGNMSITHPELRRDLQLWIAVFNGPDSALYVNGVPVFGELGDFFLPALFAINGRKTAHGNDDLSNLGLCAIYSGVLSPAQIQEIHDWGASIGLEVPRDPYTGTSDLQDLLDAVPDGGVLDLGGLTYVTDRPLVVENRASVTITNGMILAPGDGSSVAPTAPMYPQNWPRARCHILVIDSTDITIIGIEIQGPNLYPLYNSSYEEQAGVAVYSGVNGLRIVDCHIHNVYGDAVTGSAGSRNIDVLRLRAVTIGRQGVSFNLNRGVRLIGCDISKTGRSGIDIEPYTTGWFVADVDIMGCTVKQTTNLPLAVGGVDAHFNVRVDGNTFGSHWCYIRGRGSSFTNNVCDNSDQLIGEPTFDAADGVVVSGNTFIVPVDGQVFVDGAGQWSGNYTNGAQPAPAPLPTGPPPLIPVSAPPPPPPPPPPPANDDHEIELDFDLGAGTFTGTITEPDLVTVHNLDGTFTSP